MAVLLVASGGAIMWAMFHLASEADPESAEARAAQGNALRALRSAKAGDRVGAINLLARLRPRDDSVVLPAVIAALDNAEASVRVAAADAIGEIAGGGNGPRIAPEAVRAAVPPLLRCLQAKDPNLRFNAARSVMKVAGASPVQRRTVNDALVKLVADPDSRVRGIGLRALGFGASRPPEALAAGLRDDSGENRALTVQLILRFPDGVDAKPRVPWVRSRRHRREPTRSSQR
jgi:HEAT repeat protein